MLNLVIVREGSHCAPQVDWSDPGVEAWHDNDGALCAYGYSLDGHSWIDWPGVARFCLDGPDEGTVTAIPWQPAREWAIEEVFRRSILPLALQARGREALHSSAVLMPRGIVGTCGVSESGKSTIAFGLSRRGHPLWADDAVAFEASGDRVTGIPLPFRIRLRQPSAAFFGENSSWLERSVRCEAEPRPLAALFILSRTSSVRNDGLCEIQRLYSARAFSAVLTHALCFSLLDKSRKRSMFHHYMNLITKVPVFELRFQPDLNRLPALLDAIEQKVREI